MASDKQFDSFLSRTFLDLEKIDEFLFRSKSLWSFQNAKAAYGGQVVGHSLVAASRCVPDEFHLHSLHCYFLAGGNTALPVLYHVVKNRHGRTYISCSVKATQQGSAIYIMQASFKKDEPQFGLRYESPMPKVPQPERLKTFFEVIDGLKDNILVPSVALKRRAESFRSFPISMKFVDATNVFYSDTEERRLILWMKAQGHIGDDLHPNIHKCCLAYMTDYFMLTTFSMRQSAKTALPRTTTTRNFTSSLDHVMWFHAPCRADQWLLMETVVDYEGDGRVFIRGKIWNTDGNLVVTVTQEAVARRIPVESKL